MQVPGRDRDGHGAAREGDEHTGGDAQTLGGLKGHGGCAERIVNRLRNIDSVEAQAFGAASEVGDPREGRALIELRVDLEHVRVLVGGLVSPRQVDPVSRIGRPGITKLNGRRKADYHPILNGR